MIIQYSIPHLCLTFGLMLSLNFCTYSIANIAYAKTGSEITFKKEKELTTSKGQRMEFEATVVYKAVEKGFYALEADNGLRLKPLNLPLAMRVHGTRVKIEGVIKQDMVTTTNYGEVFEISSIKLLSKGQGHNSY